MRKQIIPVAFALSAIGTIFGVPALAQQNIHPVVYLGDCPQRGGNSSRWISVHGHHAIALSTDGSDWAGFLVTQETARLDHHILPQPVVPRLPAGTLSFTVLSSSISDPVFFEAQWTNTGCFIRQGDIGPVNGVVTMPITSNVGQVQVYLDDQTAYNVIVGAIRINRVALPGITLKDSSEATDFTFCSTDGDDCI